MSQPDVKATRRAAGLTADDFRQLALSLPEAVEAEHQSHPDFRVGGKIFATLGPQEEWGMLKLTPEQQAAWVTAEPDVFEPFAGAWGRRGSTRVELRLARLASVTRALEAAWRNTAPARLVRQHPQAPEAAEPD